MAVRQGINSAHLKSRNRGLVLQQIASGSISRAAIARQIGLTKMTVTNLVGELIEAGVVQEKAAARRHGGWAQPVPLAVAPHAPKVAGLYIARETAGMILTDLQLRVLASRTVPLAEETADTLRGKLFRLADEALRAAGGDPVAGIGVSAIGRSIRITACCCVPQPFSASPIFLSPPCWPKDTSCRCGFSTT